MKNDILIIRDLIDKAVQKYGLEAVQKTINSIFDFYKREKKGNKK